MQCDEKGNKISQTGLGMDLQDLKKNDGEIIKDEEIILRIMLAHNFLIY